MIFENNHKNKTKTSNDVRFNIDNNYILEKRVMVIRAGDVIPKIVRVVRTPHNTQKEMYTTASEFHNVDDKKTKNIQNPTKKKDENENENKFKNDNRREITAMQNSENLINENLETIENDDIVQEHSSTYSLPKFCPSCGSKVEKEAGGILVRCTGGYLCEAQVVYY